MEFSRLTVNNVQSIESLDFEFPQRDSGGSFVTLVGPSSSGKSALLRGVHALVNNTSTAAVLLRSGAAKFSVGLQTTTAAVTITRGRSHSTYSVGDQDYTKSGTSVPEAARQVLGIKESDLHLRFQFDRPYLLDLTSGQAAAALARLSHAHILRDAAGEASKTVRAKTSEVSVLETELSSTQQALSDLGDVEAQGQQVERIKEHVTSLNNTLSRAASAQQALTVLKDARDAHSVAQDALRRIPDISEDLGRVSEAVSRVEQVQQAVDTVAETRRRIDAYQPLPAHDCARRLAALKESFSRLQQVQGAVEGVHTCRQALDQINSQHQQVINNVAEGQREVDAVRDELQVCPTCGQEIAHEEVHA